MPPLCLFIHHINPSLLQSFFNTFGLESMHIDWQQSIDSLIDQIQAAISQLSPVERVKIYNSINRIEKMTSNYSQRLLIASANAKAKLYLATLSSSRERACWFFLRDLTKFEQAEAIAQADYTRCKQFWSYYATEPIHEFIECSTDQVNTFNRLLEQSLGLFDEQVKTRITKHMHLDANGVEKLELHLSIYHGQLQETYLIYDQNCDITSRQANLVLQYQMVYTPLTGMIEVHAPDKSRRVILAHTFAHVFLQQNYVVFTSFILSSILGNSSLPYDSADGIVSINIAKIQLQDGQWNSQVDITLPPTLEGVCDMNKYIENYFSKDNPLKPGSFTLVGVTIVIFFHPSFHSNCRKPLSISIRLPNHCDLRCRTEEERSLGEKYLKQWGIAA